MRGDIVFRVYGVHQGGEKDSYFGAYRSMHEAREHVAQLESKEMSMPQPRWSPDSLSII